ncbi:MAG: hypothetical protein IJB96_04490 [Lachnospira sp.]|nr:hypothetical protein [Lachnospira sp.]
MSNYVWNKVICDKDILEKYFIDYNPFGDGNLLDKPYITFNKLFDIKTLDEYATKLGVHIYYGDGFSYKRLENNKYEILFCTKWKYPIAAIKKALTLSHNIEWYAVEENCIYVSKFYWNNGIKENVMVIDDGYEKWLDNNIDFSDNLEDYDHDIWYYLQTSDKMWVNWESNDDFKRYEDSVVKISFPFINSL